jgi:alcohol dehydrogenase YqhD (iron-dependent ADH family)
MTNFIFQNPVKMIFGCGQIRMAGKEAMKLGKRCLIVTGKGSAKKTGVFSRIFEMLKKEGIQISELPGIDPNPRINHVIQGAEICKKEKIEFLIGLGGGSVMDCTKAISAAVFYPLHPWEMVLSCNGGKHSLPSRALPKMMIPTIAATGSEMNAGSVITNPDTTEKLFFVAQCMYPEVTIADPELTATVPPDQTAYGISDIMAHVTESYFTDPAHNPLQDRWVESVLHIMREFGKRAVVNGGDIEARTQIQWASIAALNGWIQAGVKKGFPVHVIEHALSAHYDIAHGAGLSIINPAWMKFSVKHIRDKLCQMGSRVFSLDECREPDDKNAFKAVSAFETFLNIIGSPTRLSKCGIRSTKFERIADDIIRLAGNEKGFLYGRPDLSKDDIIRILEMAA